MNPAPSTLDRKRRTAKIHERPNLWHDSAPKKVLKAHASGTPDKAWKIWVRHRSSQRPPRELERAVELVLASASFAVESPLFGTAGLFSAANQRRRRAPASDAALVALSDWREALRGSPLSLDAAHELLLAAYRAPYIAARMPQHAWWELLTLLRSLTEPAAAAGPPRDAVHLLLGIELPLVLSALLPDIGECRHSGGPAAAALAALLDEMASHASWLAVGALGQAPSTLASLARCLLVSRATNQATWSESMSDQLGTIAGQLSRMVRPDGSLPFVESEVGPSVPPILDVLAKLGVNRRLARLVIGPERSLGPKAARRLSQPGFHLGDQGVAVLRADWSRRAPRVAVDFSTPEVRLEASIGKRAWIAGVWEYELSAGGRTLPRVVEWHCNCWASDDRGDFLELQGEIDATTRLDRQIFLSKTDGFLLLADCLATSLAGPLAYRGSLPLPADVSSAAAEETREVRLAARRPLANVLPLALSEWRSDGRGGSFVASATSLELQARSSGAGLYAPLWIDLDRRRLDRPLTWRQLTVADTRQIQSPGVAAGFRVQSGARQWLVYKSVAPPAARTVLGHHLSSDFLIGHFKRSGKLDRLVDIEPS